jgi:PKD repeat protein
MIFSTLPNTSLRCPVIQCADGLALVPRLTRAQQILRHVGLACVALLVTACGGGGGGGGGGGSTNTPPSASFTATPSSGSAPLAVAFDASASSDPGGSIATYAWNFGDGGTSSGTGVTASRTYTANGTYTVTLTVTDNLGLTASTTRTVTVSAPNVAPTAAFQFVPTGGPAPLFVFFDGSASTDPEGPIASYTWDFGDGTESVSGKTPSHTFALPGTFTVRLTVQDGQGASASTTQSITVTTGSGGAGNPIISGRIEYVRVPLSSTNHRGLDYSRSFMQPAREVVVELIPAGGGSPLATTTTDSDGYYAFTAPANTNVFVRARAQARRTSTPTFDIRVLNNTGGNALYVLDGSTFNTGTIRQTVNLGAGSGWGGSGYVETRAAAPFAILDTLYAAAEFVHDNGSATRNLPALDAYWSPRNTTADGNVADGNIGSTSFIPVYSGGPPPGIYVLGLENNDTDEYDPHVIAHEFQHYLEDAISRSDTPGGDHSTTDRLDLRLAFSEGFANAFSGMVLGNPIYRDTLGPQQGQSFFLDLESNTTNPSGWFNEASVQSIVWDLFDAEADGVDTVQLGYRPMYDALVGPLRTTPALTSIYPFLTYIRSLPGVSGSVITALAQEQGMRVNDAFGTGETNTGSIPEALPIYKPINLNGGPVTVCGTTTAGVYNKVGNRQFLRFSLGAGRLVSIRAMYTATGSTAPFSPTSDPDIVLFRSGFLDVAETTTGGDELLTRTLEAGEYVIEVYEWSHIDPTYSAAQRRGKTCFNVTVTG